MINTKFSKIEKVVVNSGIGRLSAQANFKEKLLPEIIRDLAAITGQKPAVCGAKKSISNFKLRIGTPVGLKVTLRGKKMTEFLKRLTNVVFPRVRDFRGIDLKKIDQNGNLNIGLKEHLVFPEIKADVSSVSFGVEITIVPKVVKSREETIKLYRDLGVPLQK